MPKPVAGTGRDILVKVVCDCMKEVVGRWKVGVECKTRSLSKTHYI